MKCPKCQTAQDDGGTECLHCGIIFSKYNPARRPPIERTPAPVPETKTPDAFFRRLLFEVKPETEPAFFWLKAALFIALAVWGLRFILTPMATNYAGNSFLHMINLPFHETGHIIFRPFGRVVTSLGGTLGQLMIPLICMITLLVKTRDTFGASVTWWWFGENFIDIAPYINDARSLVMPLVGGNTGRTSPYGFHDWEFILTETGLIRYDHTIASLAHSAGTLIMISSLLWGGLLLYKSFQSMAN
jgi:hypothetical protein